MRAGLVYGHQLLRDALQALLVAADVQVRWTAGTAAEASRQEAVDLLVSEMSLTDGSGLALLEARRSSGRRVRGLMLLRSAAEIPLIDPEIPHLAYVPIWTGSGQLGEALKALSAGRSSLPAGLRQQRADGRVLTPGEQKVLQLLSDGLSPEEAARVLHVSVNTTKTHLRGVYRKLRVRHRTQAVVEALRLGLVAPPELRHPRRG